jgi:hypothetical protein
MTSSLPVTPQHRSSPSPAGPHPFTRCQKIVTLTMATQASRLAVKWGLLEVNRGTCSRHPSRAITWPVNIPGQRIGAAAGARS